MTSQPSKDNDSASKLETDETSKLSAKDLAHLLLEKLETDETSKLSAKDLADRLLNRDLKQYEPKKREAALQSCQAALTIYREIGDRLGEACALNNIGKIYLDQAGGFSSQALEIFKELGSNGESTTQRQYNSLISLKFDWFLPSGEKDILIPVASVGEGGETPAGNPGGQV